MKKLHDKRGETMVELLTAFVLFLILLAALTVLLGLGIRLNRRSSDADRAFYSDFAPSGESVTVTVSGEGLNWTAYNVPCQMNEAGLFCFGTGGGGS